MLPSGQTRRHHCRHKNKLFLFIFSHIFNQFFVGLSTSVPAGTHELTNNSRLIEIIEDIQLSPELLKGRDGRDLFCTSRNVLKGFCTCSTQWRSHTRACPGTGPGNYGSGPGQLVKLSQQVFQHVARSVRLCQP